MLAFPFCIIQALSLIHKIGYSVSKICQFVLMYFVCLACRQPNFIKTLVLMGLDSSQGLFSQLLTRIRSTLATLLSEVVWVKVTLVNTVPRVSHLPLLIRTVRMAAEQLQVLMVMVHRRTAAHPQIMVLMVSFYLVHEDYHFIYSHAMMLKLSVNPLKTVMPLCY